jgi:seryl-tRNA synthetase
MLDIKFIRENADIVKKGAVNKSVDPQVVDKLLEVDKSLHALLQEVETQRAQVNEGSKKIAQTQDADERTKAIAEMSAIKDSLQQKEQELRQLEADFHTLMLQIPQPCSPETPVGKDDTENIEVRKEGAIPKFNFEPKDHVQLGHDLDILDIPRGVKTSGSRFYYLKGEGAMLEHAILSYTLHKLVSKGFTAFNPPILAGYNAMMGTGYFPGGEEQAYAVGVDKTPNPVGQDRDPGEKEEKTIEGDNLYLIGTSEVPVAAYHYDEMLQESELPKLYAGISPCFRREAGTYGKDTHGLYRVHQFQKVEQVVICKNDEAESAKMHQMLLANAEEVLQDLKLPYRVVNVCTGDIGNGQYFKNDIECWMPSRDSYGETHSCSTFHEFQARRLKIRYKTADGQKKFCHTLNNTCIASPRILIPILEIYQQQDGSVVIPEVLRPLMQGKEVIEAK